MSPADMRLTASKLPRLVAPEPGLVLEMALALEQVPVLEQVPAQALALEPVLALERHIRQPTDRTAKYRQ
ncbi:MAG: hypothetical protein ABIK32_06000 [Chloroflexota bacterium]